MTQSTPKPSSWGKTSSWGYAIRLLLKHGELFGKRGPWVALAGFLMLEWLAHATAVLIAKLSESLLAWHAEPDLATSARGVVLPTLLLGIAVAALVQRLRKLEALEQAHADAVKEKVFSHKGLIASVSLLNPVALREAIGLALVGTGAGATGPNHRRHVLRLLYGTTWGPLAAAVELHHLRLQHVWLFCTEQVHGDFALVEKWIRFLVGRPIQITEITVKDRNDVHATRRLADAVYSSLETVGLKENQVIADITSGTAAMSAGIILATLDEQRHVQYLSQDPRQALLVKDEPRTDLDAVFQFVETSPQDVARAFVGLLEAKAPDVKREGEHG